MESHDNPYTERPKDFIGEELRRRRKAHKLSQRELAARMFISGGYMGQIEVGKRRLTEELAERLDKELKADGFFSRLLAAMKRNTGLTDYFADVAELQLLASAVYHYGQVFVPGILQTEAYIRAQCLGSTAPSPGVVDTLVKLRTERARKLLKDPEKPYLWVVLHESVLRTAVGGPSVMAEQLRTLAEVIRAGRVHIQVVPFSAGMHGCTGGMVSIMTFSDAPDLVYTEGAFTGQTVDDPDLVAKHRRAYDVARSVALSPEKSLAFIETVVEEYERCVHDPT
ncbi:helix-turn-helix domain-containing protein [Streptomyces clavuligerus]|uniref:DNA-binding protein n=1 Tax=Streptomyces clavuligerus TaxID=1901 RepID=B5GXW3_STRCL|nr:helix-turn-helix transcriptional regulator [Streptomyces clavuligerus]ANW19915.1 transcriptional regulator [Streptomyces clavuligerus]AXU14534.1 XRE family transcriptional regulator [Streptomyces clavuligerus]EDY51159.1 conserved hypothetical protein [Streptomyces clavuligerus]EFG07208.1 DNA-binding protein [Streptomyces clavuligerus]MBY6304546.1 helix-turn-helix transcriptional regulator [Streptomyces clavuligerus]